jgi:hypothetical protein
MSKVLLLAIGLLAGGAGAEVGLVSKVLLLAIGLAEAWAEVGLVSKVLLLAIGLAGARAEVGAGTGQRDVKAVGKPSYGRRATLVFSQSAKGGFIVGRVPRSKTVWFAAMAEVLGS